jgi:hypothetical protein
MTVELEPGYRLCSQRANLGHGYWTMMIIDYRRRVLMTTLAPNLSDPAGPGGISDCKPDDKIRLIIGSEDVMHCARLSGRPVGVRGRPIL